MILNFFQNRDPHHLNMDVLAFKLKKDALPSFRDGSGPTSIAFATGSFVSNSTMVNSLWIRLTMWCSYRNNITTFPKYLFVFEKKIFNFKSFSIGTDKEDVVRICNGILLSHEKE